MKYFISAGEASGDLHASQLAAAIKQVDRQAQFVFLGGDKLQEVTGVKPLVHYSSMAYMGFTQVLLHSLELLGILSLAKKTLAAERPDCLILVDYPSFNLKLAAEAARLNIPVYYYISPKVWAWKEGRVKKMRRYIRRIFSILPFEVEYYSRRHGIEVTYAGNPSVEEVDRRMAELKAGDADGDRFRAGHHIPGDKPLLALVPGSRRSEIMRNLPVMLRAASRFPGLRPVIAAAPAIDASLYRRLAPDTLTVSDATFDLMACAEGALVTSGTATLEAALIGVPQVVCYRANGSRLAYNLFKRILKVDYVSLPNLIVGREIVAEELLHLCTPSRVADALADVLPGAPGYRAQQQGYADMRGCLGTMTASQTAARAIVSDLRELSGQTK